MTSRPPLLGRTDSAVPETVAAGPPGLRVMLPITRALSGWSCTDCPAIVIMLTGFLLFVKKPLPLDPKAGSGIVWVWPSMRTPLPLGKIERTLPDIVAAGRPALSVFIPITMAPFDDDS